jgi:hypothetical protein
LDEDTLSLIVTHVAGGHGQHDLAHWKDACMLAMACTTMLPLVKQSTCFEKVKYLGELVGPDVAPGRDVSKESKLLVDRHGALEPKVRVVFQYGHEHEDHFTYKMQWSVPLQLKEVQAKFYKPPGWKEAADIELCGDKIPYRKTFPIDKYPIAPSKMKAAGPMRFVASKHLTKSRMDALGVSYSGCTFDDLSSEIPAGMHVTITCSTGIESFPSGDRAHYLPDLEIGLCGALPPALFDHPDFKKYAESMGLHRAEPPDLWYRWLPEEARKIAGYSSDPSDLESMINPRKAPKKPKRGLTKLNMLRKSTDFMLDEWDPTERKRQKREARERMQASLRELSRRETAETEGPEHLLPCGPEEPEEPEELEEEPEPEGPHEELPAELPDEAASAVSSLDVADALEMLEELEDPAGAEAAEAGPSGLAPPAPDYDSDDSDQEFDERVRKIGREALERERESIEERLQRLNAERDQALSDLLKLGRRRRE